MGPKLVTTLIIAWLSTTFGKAGTRRGRGSRRGRGREGEGKQKGVGKGGRGEAEGGREGRERGSRRGQGREEEGAVEKNRVTPFLSYLDFKEVTCSLTVTGCQDGSMNMEEVLFLKKVMNGHCGCVPDSQQTRESIGSGTQVWELPDILQAMAFASLERIFLKWTLGEHCEVLKALMHYTT